jgi:competence protein ComEA
MKGCTDYTEEARGWARSQGAESRFPKKILLVLFGIAAIIALIVFFPKAPTESFSVDTQQNSLVPATQTALATEVDPPAQTEASRPTAEEPLVVYLTGAVANPGVFELKSGMRLNDAVINAGGLRDDAALQYLNLAALLTDGMHVHIPTLAEIESGEAARIELSGASISSISTGGGEASSQQANQKINLNKASKTELETLPGVGTATAQRIIDYREKNGPFAAIEDLKEVSGIGDKKFEDLVDKVCV